MSDHYNTFSKGLPFPKGTPAFRSLVDLEILCQKLTFCTGILNAISSGTLRTARIDLSAPATSSEWKELLTALNEHCSHTTFIDLEVWSDWHGAEVEDTPEYTVQIPHIKPLFSFRNLTNVHLNPCGPVDLDDAGVEEMAMAWPNITDLFVEGNIEPSHPPRVTLTGLTPFARYCKDLHSLTIAFDATVIPPSQPEPQISSESLLSLHVKYSPIAHPPQVAAFLSDIFPNLAGIENSGGSMRTGDEVPETDIDKMWTEVEALIGVFAAVRTQERARWTAEMLRHRPRAEGVEGPDVLE